jgi:hypothetical protein
MQLFSDVAQHRKQGRTYTPAAQPWSQLILPQCSDYNQVDRQKTTDLLL